MRTTGHMHTHARTHALTHARTHARTHVQPLPTDAEDADHWPAIFLQVLSVGRVILDVFIEIVLDVRVPLCSKLVMAASG